MFCIPLATMILRLSNRPNVYLFITFIGFFVSYNLEQKRCSSLRDFHYKHRPPEPWKSLLLPLSFYSENSLWTYSTNKCKWWLELIGLNHTIMFLTLPKSCSWVMKMFDCNFFNEFWLIYFSFLCQSSLSSSSYETVCS